MLPASPNHEWLKILVAAVAGMLAGLIGDPIRAYFSDWLKARTIVKGIRFDALVMYLDVQSVLNGSDERDIIFTREYMHLYQHHWQANRNLFYDDLTLWQMKWRCENLQQTKEKTSSGIYKRLHAAGSLAEDLLKIFHTDPDSPTRKKRFGWFGKIHAFAWLRKQVRRITNRT